MYTTGVTRRTFSMERANISAIVRHLIDTGGRTGEVSMRNPYRDDKNPSFSVNTDTGLWHDFATGEGGGVLDLYAKVQRLENAPRAELIGRFVADFRHLGVDGEEFKGAGHHVKPAHLVRAYPRPKRALPPPTPYDPTTTTTPGKSPLLVELFALAECQPDGQNLVELLAARVAALGCDRVDKDGAQLFPYRRGGVTVAAKFIRYRNSVPGKWQGVKRDKEAPGNGIRYEPKGAATGAIFGDTPKAGRVTVVVESEKTALLMGLVMPGFDFVAIGGANRLERCAEELREAAAVVVAGDLDEPGAKMEQVALKHLQSAGVRISREATASLRAKMTVLARGLWPKRASLENLDLADVVIQTWMICGSPRYRRFAAALSLGWPLCMGEDVKTAQEAGKVASFALWGDNGPHLLAMLTTAGLVDGKTGDLKPALVDSPEDLCASEICALVFGSGTVGKYRCEELGKETDKATALRLFGGAIWEAT